MDFADSPSAIRKPQRVISIAAAMGCSRQKFSVREQKGTS